MFNILTGELSDSNPLTAMLTHAHQDAQRTGHCHWCTMTKIVDEWHVVTGYTHAEDCKLTATLEEKK